MSPAKLAENYEVSAKSKIPVLVTETTRIVSPEMLASPGSETKSSMKSSSLESDSDSDSCGRTPPPLKGILKKTAAAPRTVGSSSGSDVALHEEGSELSDDESGKHAYVLGFGFDVRRKTVSLCMFFLV